MKYVVGSKCQNYVVCSKPNILI